MDWIKNTLYAMRSELKHNFKTKFLDDHQRLDNIKHQREITELISIIERGHGYDEQKSASNCDIQSVSQQRELLLAYENFKQQPHHDGAFNADTFIDMFLSQ